jgi:hypothetical protein
MFEDDDYAGEEFNAQVENIDSILNIGDGHFKWETFEKLYDYDKDNLYEIDNEYKKLKEKYKELQGKKLCDLQSTYHLNINDLTRKNKNLFRVLKNDYSDVNYGETRDNARIELSNIQAAVCDGLSKLYDDDDYGYDFYKYWVFYLMLNHKNVITLKI